MTKSRGSPMAVASRLSRRAHSAWNVEIHEPLQRGADERLDASPHLLGSFVGEGDGENLVMLRVALGKQVGDALRDDARLAGAGTGEYEKRAVNVQDRLALFGIQTLQRIQRFQTPDFGTTYWLRTSDFGLQARDAAGCWS